MNRKELKNAQAHYAASNLLDKVSDGEMSFSEFEGRLTQLWGFLTKGEYFSYIHEARSAHDRRNDGYWN